MKDNTDIYSELEEANDILIHTRLDIDNKADKLVLNKAIELIDSVSWKYEGDE